MRLALAVLLPLLPAQDIPSHPDRLMYRPLKFEAPDPAAMRVTLSTGTVAYLLEEPALPLVDLQVYFRMTAWEPEGKEGVASLAARLMRTGGTQSLAPEALDEELEFLGAEIDVSMSDTHGTATLSILAKDLERGLELWVDILKEPAFRKEKLELLQAQTLDRLKARNDSTASIEDREASLLFYGPDYPTNRHPTQASIESIAREDLIEFHAKTVHPSNFIIAAAGAFRKEDLARKLDAAFRGWLSRDARPIRMPPVRQDPTPGIYCFHKEGRNINQGRVTIGHMGIDVHHPDVHAIRVMSYILGAGGFSSRLMQRVRSEEGLAYDVRTDFRPGTLFPYPFKIQFQSKSESCATAARLCLDELARLQKEGVTEEELANAIRFYQDGFPALFFETKLQTVSTYAQAELLGIPKDYYRTYLEKIAALSRQDIQRVAREHLKPEKFVWIVVGNTTAIKKGDAKSGLKLSDLGPITDVPLPDPLTLERPK